MRALEKLLDARNTVDGKVLSVLLCVLLTVSVVNFAAFANSELTDQDQAAMEQTVADSNDQAANQGEADQDQSAADASQDNAAAEPEPVATEPSQGAAGEGAEKAEPVGNDSGAAKGSKTESSDKPAAADKSENKVDEASITFMTQQAYIEILGETLQMPESNVKVKVGKDLTFKAFPNSGRQIDQVTANDQVLAAQQDSTYVVPAVQVNSKLVVKVTTAEAKDAAASKESASTDAAEKPAISTQSIEASAASTAASATADDVTSQVQINAEGGAPVLVSNSKPVHADVTKPAFEGYAYAGNVTVKVTAGEGIVPADTKVRAALVQRSDIQSAVEAAVNLQGRTLSGMIAIDVALVDKTGNEVQPDGSVNVCFFNNGVSGGVMSVMCASADASAVTSVPARQVDAGCASFDVNHFGIYAVEGSEEGVIVNRPFITAKKTVVGKDGLGYISKPGDVVVYTVTVTNAGNTTMNFSEDALLDEKAPEGVQFKDQSIKPGQSTYLEYEYAVTKAEIEAGLIENVAVVGAQDKTGVYACVAECDITTVPDEQNANEPIIGEKPQQPAADAGNDQAAGSDSSNEGSAPATDQPQSADPAAAQNVHLAVDKSLAMGERPANGKKFVTNEVISYEIAVANDGNVPLTNVVVVDELADFTSDPVATLAPGDRKYFRVDYTVTEADATAGAVVNVATAQGTTPEGTLTQQFYDEERVLTEPAPVPPASEDNPNPQPVAPQDNTPVVNAISTLAAPARAVENLVNPAAPAESLTEDATPLANQTSWIRWYAAAGALVVLAGGAGAALFVRSRKTGLK